MSQTKAGAAKARETNKRKYGEDYYSKLGKVGGAAGTKAKGSIKGFAVNRKLASIAGAKGGRNGRRTATN